MEDPLLFADAMDLAATRSMSTSFRKVCYAIEGRDTLYDTLLYLVLCI